MPTKPVTDEELLERVEAYHRHGESTGAAGRELGLDARTISRSIKEAAARGLLAGQFPAHPGFEIRTQSVQVDKDNQVKSQSFKYAALCSKRTKTRR